MEQNTETAGTEISPELIPITKVMDRFVIVRVGTDAKRATDDDIKDVRRKLEKLLSQNKINLPMIVTHHAIEISVVMLK